MILDTIELSNSLVLKDLNKKKGLDAKVLRKKLEILHPTIEQFNEIKNLSEAKQIAYSLGHFAQLSESDVRQLAPQDINNIVSAVVKCFKNFNKAVTDEIREHAPFIRK